MAFKISLKGLDSTELTFFLGLTLMMEEENKNQQTNRLRNLAASTIQCWWRYHLATNWKPPRRYTYFVHVCYKLYVTEERINQNRVLAKKLREKLEKLVFLRNAFMRKLI